MLYGIGHFWIRPVLRFLLVPSSLRSTWTTGLAHDFCSANDFSSCHPWTLFLGQDVSQQLNSRVHICLHHQTYVQLVAPILSLCIHRRLLGRIWTCPFYHNVGSISVQREKLHGGVGEFGQSFDRVLSCENFSNIFRSTRTTRSILVFCRTLLSSINLCSNICTGDERVHFSTDRRNVEKEE